MKDFSWRKVRSFHTKKKKHSSIQRQQPLSFSQGRNKNLQSLFELTVGVHFRQLMVIFVLDHDINLFNRFVGKPIKIGQILTRQRVKRARIRQQDRERKKGKHKYVYLNMLNKKNKKRFNVQHYLNDFTLAKLECFISALFIFCRLTILFHPVI